MRLKYRISLAVIAFLMLVTMFIGSSYALWNVTRYQTGVNAIDTGCFELEFIETSSSIELKNAYPISDEKGLKTTPYQFKLKNICTIDAEYTIYLNTVALGDNKISDDLIKYILVKNKDSLATANSLDSADYGLNKDELLNLEIDDDFASSYAIATGTLKGSSTDGGDDGGEDTFSLRLWIDESATTAINKKAFEAAIYSIAYATDLSE